MVREALGSAEPAAPKPQQRRLRKLDAVTDCIDQILRADLDLAEISFPTVDGLRCVRVRTNRYSVPLRPGAKIEAKVNADSVELWHEGKRVARHERCYSRQQQIFDLEHYLDVLERKPGALAGSTAR
jgi:hypothetical protein